MKRVIRLAAIRRGEQPSEPRPTRAEAIAACFEGVTSDDLRAHAALMARSITGLRVPQSDNEYVRALRGAAALERLAKVLREREAGER